ncbi:MAG: ABC transporter permease [Limnochordaceae bacterium]|nr:ABC transporter permease [Limnochordaceae bacterium]
MISPVSAELMKLRRHSILWLGALGAVVPVVLDVAWYYAARGRFDMSAETFVRQAVFTVALLEGPAGAAIIGTMLFGREYTERTLPNLLASAVPRSVWVGAKWIALAIVGLGILMSSWALTLGTTALVMGTRPLTPGLVLGSLAAYAAAAFALYGTSAIAVGLTLATRNQMAGVGWGVAATMAAVVGINSKYAILFPGSVPWIAGALAFEAVSPSLAQGPRLAAQFAWTGISPALTVTLITLTVWVAGVAFSLWHVHRADFP